jgi:hypothetical protein
MSETVKDFFLVEGSGLGGIYDVVVSSGSDSVGGYIITEGMSKDMAELWARELNAALVEWLAAQGKHLRASNQAAQIRKNLGGR